MRMKAKKVADMTEQELLKQHKAIQLVTGILAGMLITLLVMVVLLVVKKGFDGVSMGLGIIPFALSPILLLNWNTAKEIQKELDFRKKPLR
jgi:formate/nitrite transporter FocA (FNT family)